MRRCGWVGRGLDVDWTRVDAGGRVFASRGAVRVPRRGCVHQRRRPRGRLVLLEPLDTRVGAQRGVERGRDRQHRAAARDAEPAHRGAHRGL
eukprot:1495442-Prymnesium_polylepis.1